MKSAAVRAAFRNLGDRLDADPFLPRSRHLFSAGVSARRLFMCCLQIAAIALSLAASPRAEAVAMRAMAFGSGAIASPASCDARNGGEGAPTHRRHDPAQCCIACNTAAREPSAFFTDAPSREAYFFVPATTFCVVHRIANGPNPRAKDCANNWSARAPPSYL